MIIAYGLISRELYRGIQFELEQKKGQCGETYEGDNTVQSDLVSFFSKPQTILKGINCASRCDHIAWPALRI